MSGQNADAKIFGVIEIEKSVWAIDVIERRKGDDRTVDGHRMKAKSAAMSHKNPMRKGTAYENLKRERETIQLRGEKARQLSYPRIAGDVAKYSKFRRRL